MRRVLLALAFAAWAPMVWAQTPVPSDAPSSEEGPRPVELLPRAMLRLEAQLLSSDDPGFVWDMQFGGEVDLVDYRTGRATFVANYQVILGEQLHRFDANQGNYIIGLSGSRRLAGLELAFVFHHESRHLSDRPKVVPVEWNMFGGRVTKQIVRGPLRLDSRADIRGVVYKSFVDYDWEVDAGLRSQQGLRLGTSVIAAAGVRLLGVNGSQNRGTQTGFRGEGGVRYEGRGGAAELYVAYERRIDPYPIEFGTVTWLTAGLRLQTR